MSRFDVHPSMGARAAHADDELTLVSDVALSAFLDEVRLLSAAAAPAPTGDLAVLLEHGFEPAAPAPRAAPRAPRESAPLRRWMSRAGVMGAPLAMKLATAATAAAATFGGAAALDVLPDGLQRWASDVAAAANVSVPDGREAAVDAGAPVSDQRLREAPPIPAAGGQESGEKKIPGDDTTPDGRGGRGGSDEDPIEAAREAAGIRRERAEDKAEERRERAEDEADERRDAEEDARDDADDTAREQQRAREDAQDEQRDAEEDAADDAEDADDARDDARDEERDDAEDAQDDQRDADEDAADDADDARDDVEDATDDEADADEDAVDDAVDADEDSADEADDAADDAGDAAEDAADDAEDAEDDD